MLRPNPTRVDALARAGDVDSDTCAPRAGENGVEGKTRVGAACLLAVVWVLAGCAHAAPAFPAVTLPLTSLVPEGVRTVVTIDLAELRRSPTIAGSLDAALSEEDRDILEAWLRIPLARVDRAVLAFFEEGYVVLVEGASIDAPRLVRDAGVRMGRVEISDDAPFLRRAGRLGVERRELVALAPTRVAIGGENGAAMIALLEVARGQAHSPLDAPDGAALLGRIGPATLMLASLSPLTLPSESEVAVLLARNRMLGVGVGHETVGENVNPGRVRVRVGIVGELPPGADQNLRMLAESVVSSPLGGLFGMREGDEALVVSASAEGATLEHQIEAARLVTGLRELFHAEVGEIGRIGPELP